MCKKVNISDKVKFIPHVLLLAVLTTGVVACNDKNDEPAVESDTVINLPNVAVTAFRLKANSSVMANLDSVFFSIDLEHGVIFNADSLPVGTKIDKIVPNITYSSGITKAEITMEGGTTRTGTVNYIQQPNDSIDFTGDVRLLIATADEMSRTYTIKVNVHKLEPDSLVWDKAAVESLPSRISNPRNQKTVDINQKVYSLIEENDGTYTLSTSDNLYNNVWDKTLVSFPFMPDVRSLTASTDALFILDTNGNLFTSPDGLNWTDTAEDWNKIIGGYRDTVVGLKTDNEGLKYAQYPLKNIATVAVAQDFPISGHSNFVTHSNKWTSSPVAFFCGGEKADGSLSDETWAFDGTNWISLSQGCFPALKGASLVPYYAFRQTSSSSPSRLGVWMILGGEKSDGTFNRTLYISYDNGVNWRKGDTLIQLPDVIPAMIQCDNVVTNTPESGNLSDAWLKARMRSVEPEWSVDGDIISWECPYIYLFGGFDNSHLLYNTIWRGAINRLRFAPII